MPEFLQNNWLAIVSILLGAFVSWFFYRLQKGDVISAKEERIKRAREELLDVVESFIINKQQISENTIINLISASERAYQVELALSHSPMSVLQDVALRLQQSRHLDVTQKSEYISQIETVIGGITESRRVLSPTSENLLETIKTIEETLSKDQKESANNSIQILKDQIIKSRLLPKKKEDVSLNNIQVLGSLFAGLITIFFSVVTLLDFSSGFMMEVATQIIASLLFALVVYSVAIVARRVAKRSRNIDNKE